MEKEKIALGEYYHILNRGNNKQDIFVDDRDRIRFLFIMLYFQFSLPFYNIGRQVSCFTKHQKFNISDELSKKMVENRTTELIGFVFMPNHFHLILQETKENGISKYMMRVQNSYTKYLNTRHNQSGHLFQGNFKRIHIKDNEQLLYLSAYIHHNPRELKKWKNKEEKFYWSSYQDFSQNNRWDNLLKHQIITDQFADFDDYKKFVETSGAKSTNKKYIF